jgi:type II secretory pathway pseudopilin PulG
MTVFLLPRLPPWLTCTASGIAAAVAPSYLQQQQQEQQQHKCNLSVLKQTICGCYDSLNLLATMSCYACSIPCSGAALVAQTAAQSGKLSKPSQQQSTQHRALATYTNEGIHCQDTHVCDTEAPLVTSTGTCTAPPAMLTGLGVKPPRSWADLVRGLMTSFLLSGLAAGPVASTVANDSLPWPPAAEAR